MVSTPTGDICGTCLSLLRECDECGETFCPWEPDHDCAPEVGIGMAAGA
jgi:hypothetical protein